MGLKGKLTCEVEVRSSGDLFHELFASNPHHVSKITPEHFQSCELHEGEFGKNGSVIFWNYTINGKSSVSKQIVENLNEEKKTITFRVIEGDMLKLYKTMLIHLRVVPEPGNIDLVDWTLEYERLTEDSPHPVEILEFGLGFTKNIENHHLNA